jgi:hypothetical protein
VYDVEVMRLVENHHSGRGRPPLRPRVTVVALLAALTIGFYWRLLLTDQYTWVNGPDIARQVLPWLQFQAAELRAGRIPLWDPYLFGGQPLLAQAQPGAAYPLNWILLLAPLRNGWIQLTWLHWYFVAIHFMAVVFAYRLCRGVGTGRSAAVAGGIVYGLGGFMGQNDWPQMLNGAVWIPLVLLCLLRAARREDPWYSAAAGGLCLGMAFLAGHHQVPLYTALMAAAVWASILATRRQSERSRWAGAALLFFVTAALVGAAQSLPALEYAQHAYRWVGAPNPTGPGDKVPYHVHELYSLRPDFLLGIVFPTFASPAPVLAGATAFLLACCAIAYRWSCAAVRVATFVWIGGILFAMGGSVIFHGLLYAIVPMLEKARTPAMGAAVAHCGMALLVAFGLEAVRNHVDAGRKWAVGLGTAVFIAWLAIRMANGTTGDTRVLVTALCAILTGLVLGAWERRALSWTSAAACLIGLILVDLGNGQVAFLRHRNAGYVELDRLRNTSPVVEAVRRESARRGEWGRVDFGNDTEAAWAANSSIGDFFGIDTYMGYLASVTANVVDAGLANEETRLHYGVRYVVANDPQGEWNELVAHGEGWKLWRNRNAFPRVWTIHENGPLESPAAVERCGPRDETYLLRRESNRVVIWVEMACTGVVVLSDTTYPGWEASVDGQPAPVLTAYKSLRAVAVPKGAHRVEMRYRPWSVTLGVLLTLAGMLAVPLAAALDLRYKL